MDAVDWLADTRGVIAGIFYCINYENSNNSSKITRF